MRKPTPPLDLWEALEDAVAEAAARPPVERPENSFTTDEFAKRFNIGRMQAGKRIKALKDAGKVENTSIYLRAKTGAWIKRPAFLLVKQ